MNQQQNHEREMGRPGDGILAEHDRRAALTNHMEVGEMFTVDPGPVRGEELDWRARAACRDVDPELFFPTPIDGAALVAEERRAPSVCRVCPVLAACRSWAIVEQPHGIAGGLAEDERRRARQTKPRRTGRAEVPAVVPGPSPRTDRAPVIAAGRTALTAGADRDDIARTLGVTRRTVDRWAATLALPVGGGR
ncbi:WhiB family transcriptional regulator [Pseudonocardia alni]|uniref:WhiB family transcriptional regulator n=1 Tax=Pseudonocardia alni TaxID=33907 RepID=UPI000A9B3B6F